ncbi:hypothetical protein HZC31_00405 [Candidatus Woesearchaeota archaeon]|nr:hypothetical protein [Candidatus Woesearchaeota archaeon]
MDRNVTDTEYFDAAVRNPVTLLQDKDLKQVASSVLELLVANGETDLCVFESPEHKEHVLYFKDLETGLDRFSVPGYSQIVFGVDTESIYSPEAGCMTSKQDAHSIVVKVAQPRDSSEKVFAIHLGETVDGTYLCGIIAEGTDFATARVTNVTGSQISTYDSPEGDYRKITGVDNEDLRQRLLEPIPLD